MRRALLLLLVLVALLVGACRPVDETYVEPAPESGAAEAPVQAVPPIAIEPTVAPLADTAWILASLNGRLPADGGTATLSFGADGTASGSDGCNRFSTTFTQQGANLTFGPVAATMMACGDAVMAQAAEFQSTLATVTGFQQSNRLLALFAGDVMVMTFISDEQLLDGTDWTVTMYNNGRQAVTSLLAGTEITLRFGAEELSGNAGCNNFFGAYSLDGKNIAVGQLGSTMMMCTEPEGIMEQEAAFLAALQSAATFRIEGNELWLRTAADEIALIATVAEVVDLPAPEPEPEQPAVPTGRVSGAATLNIRSGPGTSFPVVAVAREGDEGTIVGRSADGGWWAVHAPSLPGAVGWVSAQFVIATNAENVVVIASPPTPTPLPTRPPATATPIPATPLPTPTPGAQIAFWADRTTINAGECATLFWDVNNVQGVWVYPQGSDFNRFPRTGQGNERVCPTNSTTWELRVLMRDNSLQFRQVRINVIQPIAPPAPPIVEVDPLNGTNWTVVNFNNGQAAVVTKLDGTNMTLSFSGGRVTGSGGCNNFNADYFISGSSLTIGFPAATQLLCTDPDGIMAQEQQMLTALASATSFSINGNQLEIRSGDSLAIVATR